MAKNKWAVGALFGAIAGFAAGILTAPKSGKETRGDIKKAASQTKDKVVEEAGKVRESAAKTAGDVKRKVEAAAHEVAHKAKDVAEDTAERAGDLKGRTQQAVEGARKGFAKKPATSKKK